MSDTHNPAGKRPYRQSPPKRMTRAKAERLVNALDAIAQCDDGPWGAAFDDVRAAVEPWMED